MADPITWRNVGSGGGANPAALLAMGQNQVQQGLSALGDLFKNEQRMQQQNALQVRDNNTATYLDQVAAAGGLDALQDPTKRAALEATRAGFGAAIDRNATRDAIDSRVQNLQKQTMVANQFSDQVTERDQRDLVDQGLKMAQAGDMQGVQKLLSDTQFLNEGKVASDLMGVLDARTRRAYAAEDQARQGRSEVRQIAQFQESMASAAENRIMRKEAMTDAREQRAFRNGSKVLDDAAEQAKSILKTRLQGNEWADISTDPGKDAATMLKGVEKGAFDSWLGSNKGDRRQMQTGVVDLLTNGITVDNEHYKIPPAMLQQELNNIAGKSWITDNPMDDIRKALRDSLTGNVGAGNRAKALDAANIRAQAQNMMETLKRAKTQLGTSSSFDTSGIVKGLADLAGKTSISGPNLLPKADEELKNR